jgi:chromosome partitioning protein
MRTIMVLNAKGGCGKSTLSTNIAGYFAHAWDGRFGLIDFDPQRSALDWLKRRPGHLPYIAGFDGYANGIASVPSDIELLVIDPPARCHGNELERMVSYAETFIVPVQPSPIDIGAANKFIQELHDLHRVQNKEVKIAVVANRVRENLKIWGDLERFLNGLKIPFVTHLRDAQNYIRAYTRGMGVHELPPYLGRDDVAQWEPLVKWLESKNSVPKVKKQMPSEMHPVEAAAAELANLP